jgi:predicted nucleotidyltransferase
VEVDSAIGLRFVDLAEEIETALGIPKDVVSSRAIKPRYWKVIQKDLIEVT